MVENLHILNFKKIKALSLQKLSRVNLLVGDNNVGKSTILEAMSLYLANGSDRQIWKLLKDRGESMPSGRENISDVDHRASFLSLFHNRQENYSSQYGIWIGENLKSDECLSIHQVYLSENRTNHKSSATLFLSQEEMEREQFNITDAGIRILSKTHASYISYKQNAPGFMQVARIVPFEYVRSSDLTLADNASRYDAITLTDLEQYVAEALRIINPDIDRISFINDSDGSGRRIPVASLRGSKDRIRLSSMGDGIIRMLTVILALLNCKDGAFLIDEFETGLYYTVQDKLWKTVFMLAEKLNIQVFATTHSSDCIRSFAKANDGSGTLTRLEEQGGVFFTTAYSDSELIFATNNQIELR